MKPRIRIRDGKPVYSLVPIHRPNREVIQHCEHLLHLAKSGELRAMIEVVEWDDGSVASGFRLTDHSQKRRMFGEMFTLGMGLMLDDTPQAKSWFS